MSFKDCIATAVDAGKLSAGKGAEASQAYDDAVAEGLNEGLSPVAAEARAAHAAVEATTKLTSAKRWERINSMRKMHALKTTIDGDPNPLRAMTSVLDDVMDQTYLNYRAVSGQLMANINTVMEAFAPKLAGIVTPIKHMDNVVRELYGIATGDKTASELAEATRKVLDQTRKMLNLEGASVPENPNYRFPQTHDRFLVRNATKSTWVSEHLADGVLDWDIMEYEGKKIPVSKRQEILEKVYDAIVTEGNNKLKAGQPDNSTLAARLSRERFLFYKTGEAWLTMQKKYGTGNFYHQLIEQVDSSARSIGLMRTFGPSPESGAQFAERSFKSRVAALQAENPKGATKLEVRMDKALDRFRGQYDINARRVNTGQGDVILQTINTGFSILNTALLGGAVVSNLFGDISMGQWTRMINRMPQWHVVPNYLHAIANNKAFRKQVIDDGIIFESMVSMAYEAQRYNVALEGAHWARKMSEINYRIQGAAKISDVGRGIAGMDLQKALARAQGLKFDEIPFVAAMRNLGITERDWELVRGTELYQPEYYSFGRGKFLRPIDMYKAAKGDEGRAAADKFLMLQEMFVRDLVPGPTLRARYALGTDVTSTRWAGQVLKASGQLALFPASIMFNHWRMVAAAPNWTSRIWRAGTLFAYTTVAGAMIAQVKDLLAGKEPQPMNTVDFWTRAAALGGGGAIIGDFIYSNFLSANDYYSAGTPAEDQWAKFRNLMKASWGEMTDPQTDNHLGKAATDFAWGLVPKPVPFKLFMERMIMDPLLENTDPAAYRRKIEAQTLREQEQGRGHWWGTGDQ